MNTREKGRIGESVACVFLKNKGFEVVLRNYQKKWGEIDIIAKKNDITHFIEVKSTSYIDPLLGTDRYRPEDNVHSFKSNHISRMIETYFREWGNGAEMDFKFHVICVYLNLKTRRASVKYIQDVIL